MKLKQPLVPESCVKRGEFKLRSGKTSKIYYDFKDISVNQEKRGAMNFVSSTIDLITRRGDFLAGEGVGVYSMVGFLCRSLRSKDIGGLLLRDAVKEYGQQRSVEGNVAKVELSERPNLFLLQDVMTTTEGSTTMALEILKEAGLFTHVKNIIVLLDRRVDDHGEDIMGIPVISIWKGHKDEEEENDGKADGDETSGDTAGAQGS